MDSLQPPAVLSPLWWLVVVVLVAAAVAVVWWAVRVWRRLAPVPVAPDDPCEQLRRETIDEVARVASDHRRRLVATSDAARQIGALARRYVADAGGPDAEHLTAGELAAAALDDPRLEPVARIAADVDRIAYGGNHAAYGDGQAADDIGGLAYRAREVVTRWW